MDLEAKVLAKKPESQNFLNAGYTTVGAPNRPFQAHAQETGRARGWPSNNMNPARNDALYKS